jgi:hypothetical protein
METTMDLDHLKEAAKGVKAPQIAQAGVSGTSDAAEALLQEIRSADEKECRQTRKALPFYIVAASTFAFGCLAFLLGFSSGSATRAIHYGVLAAIMMLICMLMARRLRAARALDYSRPVLAFLAETQDRYRFLRGWDYAYVIPIVLVLGITGGLAVADSLIPRFVAESQRIVIWAIYGLFFIGVCCFGSYFSYRNWKRDKGAIVEEIRRMRHELLAPFDIPTTPGRH